MNTKLIEQWEESLRGAARKSENTIKSYKINLVKFFSFLLDTGIISNIDLGNVNKITLININEYMGDLVKRNISINTQLQITSSIRSFYGFLVKTKMIIKDQNISEDIDTPKKETHKRVFLKENEAQALVDGVGGCNALRNKAIYMLDLGSGMRLSEIYGLDISDMNTINDGYILIKKAKGNKERVVYVSKETIGVINEYLTVRLNTKDNALFVSTHGNRLSRKQFEHLTKQDMIKIGKPDGHFHSIRHSFAAKVSDDKTIPLTALQEVLGHESLATTSIYTHSLDEQKVKTASVFKFT